MSRADAIANASGPYLGAMHTWPAVSGAWTSTKLHVSVGEGQSSTGVLANKTVGVAASIP